MTFSKQRASRLMREHHATVTDAGNKDCRAFIEPSLFVRQRCPPFRFHRWRYDASRPFTWRRAGTQLHSRAHPEEAFTISEWMATGSERSLSPGHR